MKNDPKALKPILSDKRDDVTKALKSTAVSRNLPKQIREKEARKPIYLTRYE